MEAFKPLTERQQYILGLLVRNYIEDGIPVGSKTLVSHYDLDVSSATVRNELALLDQLGYVTQQHTSGGRIPTELGFRYFVQRLMGEFHLPTEERQMIRHQFHQARAEIDQWMRLSAAVLARISRGASIVTAPRPRFNRFKHIELISTQGRLVLMIFVLYGGQVRQQMLTLAAPLLQKQLSAVAERLNTLFDGRNFEEISARRHQLDDLEEEIALLAIDILRHADARSMSQLYRDGLVNLIDDEGTRQAVRLLEEQTVLGDILNEIVDPTTSGVQVVIGGEGRWEELRDCSIILARYGVDEELTGEVGVLGSMRMAYGRNISAVRYVADLMSGFVNEYFVEELREDMSSDR